MKLIDADALLLTLREEKVPFDSDINYFILNAPEVDVGLLLAGYVSQKHLALIDPKLMLPEGYGDFKPTVVHCNECRFRLGNVCIYWRGSPPAYVKPEDFCSKGQYIQQYTPNTEEGEDDAGLQKL